MCFDPTMDVYDDEEAAGVTKSSSENNAVASASLVASSAQDPENFFQKMVADFRIPCDADLGIVRECVRLPPWAKRAGPHRTIYFDPQASEA